MVIWLLTSAETWFCSCVNKLSQCALWEMSGRSRSSTKGPLNNFFKSSFRQSDWVKRGENADLHDFPHFSPSGDEIQNLNLGTLIIKSLGTLPPVLSWLSFLHPNYFFPLKNDFDYWVLSMAQSCLFPSRSWSPVCCYWLLLSGCSFTLNSILASTVISSAFETEENIFFFFFEILIINRFLGQKYSLGIKQQQRSLLSLQAALEHFKGYRKYSFYDLCSILIVLQYFQNNIERCSFMGS